MFPALLTAVFFAGAAVSARRSASLIGAIRANQLRLLIAILTLGGIALLSWKGMPREILLRFLIAGGIGFGLGGFCMMQALRRLGSPRALLSVESVSAVAAGALAWSLLGDRLGVSQVLACLLILAGALIAGSTWMEPRPDGSPPPWGGRLFALGASLFQACSLVLSRDAFLIAASNGAEVSTFHAAFVRLAGGLSVAFFLFLLVGWKRRKAGGKDTAPAPLLRRGQPVTDQPLFWVFVNALCGPVFGVTCWLWAVSLVNPGIVQSIAATAPLISIPLSRKLEWHQLGPPFYVGSAAAISGISLLALC